MPINYYLYVHKIFQLWQTHLGGNGKRMESSIAILASWLREMEANSIDHPHQRNCVKYPSQHLYRGPLMMFSLPLSSHRPKRFPFLYVISITFVYGHVSPIFLGLARAPH